VKDRWKNPQKNGTMVQKMTRNDSGANTTVAHVDTDLPHGIGKDNISRET